MKIYNKTVSRICLFTDVLDSGYRCDIQFNNNNKEEFCFFFDNKEEIEALQQATFYLLELYKKEEKINA